MPNPAHHPATVLGIVACLSFSSSIEAAQEFAWEGFEREINWSADTGSAATGRIVDDEVSSEGTRSLKLLFNAVADGARAIYYSSFDADWSPYGALLIDVYSPSATKELRCAIVITTTERWLDHEFMLPPLAEGWNRNLRVNFKSRKFLSAASDYRPTGHLIGRSEIKSVSVRIYPGKVSQGFLYVDNLRLHRAGMVSAGPLTLNTTLDLTTSVGNIDYLPTDMRIRGSDLVPIESFETGATWTPSQSEIVIAPATDFTSHGKTGLSVTFPASPDGFDLWLDGMENRLSGRRQLRMNIYNSGPGGSVRLQLEDAEGNTYDSASQGLRHGWNTLVFDFTNQNTWNGTVIDETILADLIAVSLNVSSQYPGRLIFDGLSASSVRLRGAAKGGALFSVSYNPTSSLEFIGDYRIEDTRYGTGLSSFRSAGAEGYLDAASLRLDTGEFRTRALYRRKINTMDQPILLLVSPYSFGREIVGIETGGRVLGMELQALLASRLEYDNYNSRQPTGFGPEGLATLRLRRNITNSTRIGVTHLTHLTRYGAGVSDVPDRRHTWGADIEHHVSRGPFALNSSIEGGVTGGARFRGPDVNAPGDDRYYLATRVSPEIGRLGLYYGYTLIGYDFDSSFMTWGGNYAEHLAGGSFKLEGFSIFSQLAKVPIYDRSLARNLELDWDFFSWISRDRYVDPTTGNLRPRSQGCEFDIDLANDEQARPNFRMGIEYGLDQDQWYRSSYVGESLRFRLPLPLEFVLSPRADITQSRESDRSSGEKGSGWAQGYRVGIERYFNFNLFLSANGNWTLSRKNWEGVWGDVDGHFKFSANARQTIGADTVIELTYGVPALFGYDFGIQDTIDVYTLTVKSYF